MLRRGTGPDGGREEPLSAQTVTALYRALLGRGPDPEGLAYWTGTSQIDEVIRSVSATEEHRQRLLLQAEAAGGGDRQVSGGLGFRLDAGDGLVALSDAHSAISPLGTLPWDEVDDPWAALRTLVLGPYGAELARELMRRGHVDRADAGLSAVAGPASGNDPTGSAGGASRIGTLLLTDEEYLRTLAQLRPDVLDRTVLRVLHPLSNPAGLPASELELRARVARQRLHDLGFVEVSQVFGRRHGGGTTVIDTSYATPDPGRQHTTTETHLLHERRPASVWLVGRRVPVRDRA